MIGVWRRNLCRGVEIKYDEVLCRVHVPIQYVFICLAEPDRATFDGVKVELVALTPKACGLMPIANP